MSKVSDNSQLDALPFMHGLDESFFDVPPSCSSLSLRHFRVENYILTHCTTLFLGDKFVDGTGVSLVLSIYMLMPRSWRCFYWHHGTLHSKSWPILS